MFASSGDKAPPAQLAIWPFFALRVVVDAAVGVVAGGVVSDWDGVADGDLVWADEDVFDQQPQHPLAFDDGRSGGLCAEAGEELFEVVGELEVDLAVGELGVEGGDLVAEARF